MRKQLVVRGLILLAIGTLFLTLGVLTGRSETMLNKEDILDDSYSYGFSGYHQYVTYANLLPGTYELRCQFSSDTAVGQFYVRVLDPDGLEVNSVYGTPTASQNRSSQLTFETQSTGQHTIILGGEWISVSFNLVKLTHVTKMVYPLEIVIYVGLIFQTAGIIASISGALLEEKGEANWLDNLENNSHPN